MAARATGGDFLLDVGDFQVGGQIDVAAVGAQFAQDGREQAGFAGAVGAGDADLVAAEDGEIDVLEQRLRDRAAG